MRWLLALLPLVHCASGLTALTSEEVASCMTHLKAMGSEDARLNAMGTAWNALQKADRVVALRNIGLLEQGKPFAHPPTPAG